MGRLILHRLFTFIPIMLLVSFGVTALVAFIPGDAATTLAGGEFASPQKIEEIREQLHLDDSIVIQYGRWLSSAFQGEFGDSLGTSRPIADELPSRIGVTAQLIGVALVFILLIVAVFGFICSMWPGGIVDRFMLSLTNVGIATPAFLLGIILIIVCCVWQHWFPALGYVPWSRGRVEWIKHLVLPAAAVAALPGAVVARQLRGGLADTMDAPFVRTAWAKGGTPWRVVSRHVLRNSAMPAVTVLGLQVGALLGGTVIVESIFNLPGVGSYLLLAINFQDLPVIQAVTVFFVFVRMLVNLAVDISYGVLDPRVRT